MLPYCSSGSQASKSECLVRKVPVLFLRGDVAQDLGKGRGVNGDLGGGVDGSGGGRGSLEGLSGLVGLSLRFAASRESSDMQAASDEAIDIPLLGVRGGIELSKVLQGENLRASRLGAFTIPFLTGARAIKLNGGLETLTIRLLMGPSCLPPRVPSDVVGLESAILAPLSFASDDFGRPAFDVEWTVGCRIPLPTLDENEVAVEADVFLE